MNCKDFEPTWNEFLDGRGVDLARSKALGDHARDCPRCAPIHFRYLLLNQGLQAIAPAPAVSPGFADRVLAARLDAEPVAPAIVFRFRRPLAALAAAAVLLIALLNSWHPWKSENPPRAADLAARGQTPTDNRVALGDAIAAARSTLEFAREASAPAARVGYELASAELPDSAPSPFPEFSVDVAPATQAILRVGDRLNEGVRPLEGSARRAFGFLIGPGGDRAKPKASAPRGA